jgi:PKD repeat protein
MLTILVGSHVKNQDYKRGFSPRIQILYGGIREHQNKHNQIGRPDIGFDTPLSTHFEGQQLYTHDDNPTTYQDDTYQLTTSWQQYTHVAVAPPGTWTIFNYLKADSGTVEFDDLRMTMGGNPPVNDPPTADFSSSINNLTVNFSDLSMDDDGFVNGWNWSFGDGGNSSDKNPSHTYTSAGAYTVSLVATDNDNEDSIAHSEQISVDSAPAGDVMMTVDSFSVNRGGRMTLNLSWTGANTTNVLVIRNGTTVSTTPNDGSWRESVKKAAGNTYTYQICETNGGDCSDEVPIEP